MSLSECRSSPRQKQILLRLHPPAQPSVLAGDYAFSLEATSRDDPDESATVSATFAARSGLCSVAHHPASEGDCAAWRVRSVAAQCRQQLKRSGAAAHRPDEVLVFTFGEAQAGPATMTLTGTTPTSSSADAGDISVGQPLAAAGPATLPLAATWTRLKRMWGRAILRWPCPPTPASASSRRANEETHLDRHRDAPHLRGRGDPAGRRMGPRRGPARWPSLSTPLPGAMVRPAVGAAPRPGVRPAPCDVRPPPLPAAEAARPRWGPG